MDRAPSNIAIILAAGSGSRMARLHDKPKQFIRLKGRAVLDYSLHRFNSHAQIDQIIVVSHKDHRTETVKITASYAKVKKVLVGGQERFQSSKIALDYCSKHYDSSSNIIIHDAARPLVSKEIVDKCLAALDLHPALSVAVPVKDTIIVNSQNRILDIPARENLLHNQTPQCFKLALIQKAYNKAFLDPKIKVSDDCSIIFKYLPMQKIHIVAGNDLNHKLSTEKDLLIIEQLANPQEHFIS